MLNYKDETYKAIGVVFKTIGVTQKIEGLTS